MIVALTRLPHGSLSSCELTFLERRPINAMKMQRQHRQYRQCLEALGVEVRLLPALFDQPDAVFIEDTAVVLPEGAVAMPMGVSSRRAEVDSVLPTIAGFREVHAMPAGCRMDGGDVLRVGRRIYVGVSARTDPASVRALASLVGRWGYEVRAVPVYGCLHLKTGCCALVDGLFLANPAWVDVNALAARRVITVPADEPWAANILRIDGRIVMPVEHRKTAAILRAEGYAVHQVDISEFAKAEAGVTCLSILVDVPGRALPRRGRPKHEVIGP